MDTELGALNTEQIISLLKQWNLHNIMGDTCVNIIPRYFKVVLLPGWIITS